MTDNIKYLAWLFNIPVLVYVIGLLIVWTIIISFIPRRYEKSYIAPLSLGASISFFFNCILLWYHFDYEQIGFQYFFEIPLIPEYNLVLSCGLDGISMCFLLLTAFIMPICLLSCGTIYVNYKQFVVYVLLVEIFLVMSFCVTNLFFFFVFFESVLIPMYIIIGVWGGRNRKINAAFYFFLYTLFGSFFLLFGILYIFTIVESFSYNVLSQFIFSRRPNNTWCSFLYSICNVKIPMFPYHIWLPEAHVEAPTIGSVILASLLLKLGGYGFLRFTIPMFPEGCLYLQPFIIVLAVIGVIYASLSAIRQSDLKRIIAYSSIAHMNLVVLGLFSFTHQGIDGAMYLMLGHGIVSAALFLCVGDLYDRYHTRALKQFSGLVQVMPLFSIVFFIFTLANMGFPGTSNFVGEILIFIGIFLDNPWVMFLSATGVVASAMYAIFLFNRVCFGTLKNESENVDQYADLNRSDFYVFFVLITAMLTLGVYSECITNWHIDLFYKFFVNIKF